MKKICVIIPALNEAPTIGDIVRTVRDAGLDVVVIDDGSDDSTGEEARRAGAHLIQHQENQGKGVSLKQGIHYVLSRSYDAAIIMDGDGQHDPHEIVAFVERADEAHTSFITGNRMDNPASMPLVRVVTNKIMSLIISAVCHQRIPDTQCGFRYITTDVLRQLHITSEKYDIESEMLIEAARSGVAVDSIPIKSIYRREQSYINPFVDTLRFIRLLIIKIFRKR